MILKNGVHSLFKIFFVRENMKKILLLSLMTVGFVGCTSTQIGPPQQFTAFHQVTGFQLQNAVKQGIQTSGRFGWHLEHLTDNVVVAGLSQGGHYMQVTYTIVNGQVTSVISKSQNLNQTKTRIHKHALSWKKRLDQNVYKEIAKLS